MIRRAWQAYSPSRADNRRMERKFGSWRPKLRERRLDLHLHILRELDSMDAGRVLENKKARQGMETHCRDEPRGLWEPMSPSGIPAADLQRFFKCSRGLLILQPASRALDGPTCILQCPARRKRVNPEAVWHNSGELDQVGQAC
ncbi:hypothetical protein ACKKBG_A01695 [Auxenochlorella protothecoides x Auxenochlorella symbiontica]